MSKSDTATVVVIITLWCLYAVLALAALALPVVAIWWMVTH